MSRIVYVNGAYLPEEEAKISVFDRGFLFADGVYEVSTVVDGRSRRGAASTVTSRPPTSPPAFARSGELRRSRS